MTSPPTCRRALTVTAAVIALLVLGACTATEPFDRPASADGPDTGLERFYEQELAFEPCDSYATTATEAEQFATNDALECARMQVPVNYSKPDGDTMQIALARAPARGERIGSLVLNTGGPGGSGLFATAAASQTLASSPMTERFDLVGFDPRGVGASIPAVDCWSDAEADAGIAVPSAVDTSVQLTEAAAREFYERCAEGSGGADVLVSLGTRDAARDMDVLRAVLGDDQLSYLGQSYGTRLGAVYAEQFPGNVRAMVLDGAFDPTQGTVERRQAAYTGFQRSFDQMAAWCATQPDCPLGTDPARATEVFQQTMRPLLAQPVHAGPQGEFELGFDRAVGGVLSGLYTEAAWPLLVQGIAEVQQGRGSTLLGVGGSFDGRSADGRWSNFSEAIFAISCMDEDRLTPEQTGQLRAAVWAKAPFMDPGTDPLAGARDVCQVWPEQPTLGYPYADDVEGLAPPLVVSITGDPTTPYEAGRVLADALGGTMLTVEGEEHTVVLGGTSPCVDAIASAYLIDLELPPEDATCTYGPPDER